MSDIADVRTELDSRPPLTLIGEEVRPDNCVRLADQLAEAIAKFARWQMPQATRGRLPSCVQILREISRQGEYGNTDAELRLAANAMMTAKDFAEIAAALPEKRDDDMANELQHAFAGTVDATERNRRPYQYQSQFWFATLLIRAGITPGIRRGSTEPSPDFEIDLETFPVLTEVKRPEGRRSINRNVDDAARRIRTAEKPGIIVLDLYDAFGLGDLVVGRRTFKQSIADMASMSFQASVRGITQRIGREKSARYQRIVGMSCFARVCSWRDDKPDAPIVTLMYGASWFPDANWGLLGNTVAHYHERIRTAIRSANPLNKLA